MANAHADSVANRVEPLDSQLMNPLIGLRLGAFFGAVAVAAGAFGAHYLKTQVDNGQLELRFLEAFKTGVQYQFYHALAIVMVSCSGGILWQHHFARWAILAWTVGIVLFSGSLYALTLTGIGGLGAITPFGGVFFIVGWVLAGLGARMYVNHTVR